MLIAFIVVIVIYFLVDVAYVERTLFRDFQLSAQRQAELTEAIASDIGLTVEIRLQQTSSLVFQL